jgi:(E)-4-hydroxy-3-methylbut-2-enyl-diphosphate synthase
MNTDATVEQSIRIFDAGADYVRITAPSVKEAENLLNIKNKLKERGYDKPLIADIHYTPNAAEISAQIVEKVRINPGNYVDKKKFDFVDYSEDDYVSELQRIKERFTPLVNICKEYGTAMRIGTNHGSLSDRIMSRYGDTPMGMVESALEFVRICEELNYYDIVLSMKASNPIIMVQANRLLINKMLDECMNYPIHLGVTEAGEGVDGRIKSSIGIGTLLEDGIGDTVRVSLTEDPEYEIPVARKLIKRYSKRIDHKPIPEIIDYPLNPFEYNRRTTGRVGIIGDNKVPVVILTARDNICKSEDVLKTIGFNYNKNSNVWKCEDIVPDFLYLGSEDVNYSFPEKLKKVFDYEYWLSLTARDNSFPLLTAQQYANSDVLSGKINFLYLTINDMEPSLLEKLSSDKTSVLILSTDSEHAMAELRRALVTLIDYNIENPVIIRRTYKNLDIEGLMLYSSTDVGGLLVDGLGDGIWIDSDSISLKDLNKISFGILQATRTRISKAEFISCPSCGRTLFNLQETTALIKKKMSHLKGVKIGVMGCIVNGPGEMADADYGFVGSGPGKISLYKGKEVVKKNIDIEIAVDELICLIKENGGWKNPKL